MLITTKTIYCVCQFILILAIGIFIISGCQKNIERINLKNSSVENVIKFTLEYHSPLDAARFSAIINDTQHISGIGISYRKPWALFQCSYGEYKGNFLLSTINDYQGELLQTSGTPLQTTADTLDFSASEVQDIFDYLSQNSDYFFNGEEYEGIYPPPVEVYSSWTPLCSEQYIFCLQIGEPNEFDTSWTINKCVDEYPSPDSPLYGLFELLEDDFISQFE